MIDSWRPRKLEPGLAHTYSKPRALIVSTMKSDPARPPVSASGSAAGAPGAGSAAPPGPCALALAAGAAMAAPTAAACRMNSRRGEEKRGRRFIGGIVRTFYASWYGLSVE